MDIIEYVDPIKAAIRQFHSLVDSFIFDIGQCIVDRDYQTTDLTAKRFRNNVNTFVKDLDRRIDKFETDIGNIDILVKFKADEEHILSLKARLASAKEDCSQVGTENSMIRRELAVLKDKMQGLECSNCEKDDLICRLKQSMDNLTIRNEGMVKQSIIHEKDSNQETELLKNVIRLKEQEIKNSKKQSSEMEKKLKKVDEDNLVSVLLVKQFEQQVGDLKAQIERGRNLEKVDQRILINTKLLLHDANDQLNHQQDQLKVDVDLISKLKNELVNLKGQMTLLLNEKGNIATNLDDERKANFIIFKDMESLQSQLSDVQNKLALVTEKKCKIKIQKAELITELDDAKLRLAEQQAKNSEIEKKLMTTESELSSLKLKLETVTKQCNKQQKELKFLHTTRSISEDKIRLLNNFIEDFRIVERDLQSRLILENHSIRSKMDTIRVAYEKLF